MSRARTSKVGCLATWRAGLPVSSALRIPHYLLLTTSPRVQECPSVRLSVCPQGIQTAEDEGEFPVWTADYDGKYEVWMWDRSRAVKLKVAEAPSLEEAARMYDQLILAQYPDGKVDTNFPLTPEAFRATGAAAADVKSFSRVGNSCALRLLQLESRVGFVCLRATSAEYKAWKQRVWDVFATRATTPDMAADFASSVLKVRPPCPDRQTQATRAQGALGSRSGSG